MSYAHPANVRFGLASAPGTAGDLVQGTAVSGFRALGAAHDGKRFVVSLRDGQAWEVRRDCIYTHATTTLTRGTLIDSSTGSAVDLSAATLASIGPSGYEADLMPAIVLDGSQLPVKAEDGNGNEYGLLVMEPGGGVHVQAGDKTFPMSKSPPRTLFRNLCPAGVAPSGTVGANGALTLTSGIYIDFITHMWLWFPAGAVYAASLAGFYWTTFSTDTQGLVYANYAADATGTGAPPDVLVPLSGTTGAAYTGWTGDSNNYLTMFDVSPDVELIQGDAIQIVMHSLFRNTDAATNPKWMRVIGNTSNYLAIRPFTSGTMRGVSRTSWLQCYPGGVVAFPQGWTDQDPEYAVGGGLTFSAPRFRFELSRGVATDYLIAPRFSIIHWPAHE